MIDENKKDILKNALISSFVDEYSVYKNIINIINNDLKKSNIEFQYSYDSFCEEFLNESLKNIENIDIFDRFEKFNEFCTNFYKFNLYILKSMIQSKIDNKYYFLN